MKVLLVGNYLFDKQFSMQKFSGVMESGLMQQGYEVRVVRPAPFFGTLRPSPYGLGKWLGYIDKFIVFPFVLMNDTRWADVVHICDHSNAVYVRCLKRHTHLVTCHDVLAIRGSLGEETDCPASWTGKWLQKMIFEGLKKAMAVACVSQATKNDVLRLLCVKDPGTVGFILNGLVSRFGILPSDEIRLRLEAAGQPFFDKPFLLHVGSDTKRKNRQVALQVFLKIKDKWAGNIVFAGAPIDKEMALLVQESNISCRVIEVISPDDGLLEALYNKAFALLFPSRFEGFGFPIIEAQACGCPVLCSSDCAPFSEIVRDSAIMQLSHDVDGFAAAIIRLSQDTSARQGLVSKGLENSKRFATDRMINEYVSLYKRLLGGDKDALP